MQPATIPPSSRLASTAPTATAAPDSGDEPREDADAAEDGSRALVPALARRRGDEPAGEVRAQQRGEGQRRDRESGDRGDRVHGQTG